MIGTLVAGGCGVRLFGEGDGGLRYSLVPPDVVYSFSEDTVVLTRPCIVFCSP